MKKTTFCLFTSAADLDSQTALCAHHKQLMINWVHRTFSSLIMEAQMYSNLAPPTPCLALPSIHCKETRERRRLYATDGVKREQLWRCTGLKVAGAQILNLSWNGNISDEVMVWKIRTHKFTQNLKISGIFIITRFWWATQPLWRFSFNEMIIDVYFFNKLFWGNLLILSELSLSGRANINFKEQKIKHTCQLAWLDVADEPKFRLYCR